MVYDTVDRDKLLMVLNMHGVGDNILKLLKSYLQSTQIMLMRNKVRRQPFHPCLGIIQGDPLSPLLFNILVDVALRMVDKDRTQLEVLEAADITMVPNFFRAFYADDGVIGDLDMDKFQRRTDHLLFILKNFGLTFNNTKTQGMVCVRRNLMRRNGVRFQVKSLQQSQRCKRTIEDFLDIKKWYLQPQKSR